MLLKTNPGQAVIADKAYDAQARMIEPLHKARKAVVVSPTRARHERREYDKHLHRSGTSVTKFKLVTQPC